MEKNMENYLTVGEHRTLWR